MNQEQMSQLRSIIYEEKKGLEDMLQENDHFGMEHAGVHESIGELSSYDNHPADYGSEMFERGKDLALNDHEEKHLHELNEALKRMDNATYGVCAKCGKEIPFERLEAMPTAVFCIEHQWDDEVSQRRPVEEQFLYPPFGRTSFDEKDNETEYDGEDSWQEVARYGTSESPSDMEAGRTLSYNDMYIESDEPIGYVEALEGFIVTDLDGGAGEDYDIVRNDIYKSYLERGEGEGILEYVTFDEEDNRL